MNHRIKAIGAAATELFLQQGYSKTQISHIAKAVKVSVGTIYLDFTGKEEILHFLLKCTIDPDFAEHEIERPITEKLFPNLEQEIMDTFVQSAADFSAPLQNYAKGYSFEAMISDAFDILSRYAVGCLFIEKNQFDFKDLADYYKAYRKQFFDTMVQYLRLFMERSVVRPLGQVELTTMLIIEILSWWAMDVRYTSFEKLDISPEAAKQICLDNILNAYQQ